MAVRDDFAPGEVLAAADLNDTFASKVDYALPVNAQTGTTYTFVAADAEKLTTASNAAAVTLTIPPQSSVTWSDNTVLRVVNYGAGAVTIDGGSGVTVTNTSSTIAQYGAAVAIRTGSDAWTVVPFGGGDVPPATVSSPAATGQYTDGGGQTWDYYTFTSSGTLTVDTAGFADVLVVGGGGGGGSFVGGGGGGGGHLVLTDAYLSAGSHTVVVGAGGGGGSNPSLYQSGNNGVTSRLGNYYGVGGAGGGSTAQTGRNGGSGGGAGGATGTPFLGGSATSGQGNNGGSNSTSGTSYSGGGGGAGAVGQNAITGSRSGNGGAGLSNDYTGSSVTRAGGGGGGGNSGNAGSGGSGGGGNGGSTTAGSAGTANTGGGGGGGAFNAGSGYAGGAGGSGIVIVRVKV